MRPSRLVSGKSDLFRERLETIIDPRHPLVRLAGLVPWSRFDDAFGRFYRPAKPTRLMVGLHYLKHVHDLSDEEMVVRWVENPYWQFFSGFDTGVAKPSSLERVSVDTTVQPKAIAIRPTVDCIGAADGAVAMLGGQLERGLEKIHE